MALTNRHLQNIRTTGATAPANTMITSGQVKDGEIVVRMDNNSPALFTPKNDKTFAQFVDKTYIDAGDAKAIQSVNGKTGSAVTINSDDVKVGTNIVYGEGSTAVTIATTSSSVTQAISSVLDEIEKNEKVTAEALTDLDGRVTTVDNNLKNNYYDKTTTDSHISTEIGKLSGTTSGKSDNVTVSVTEANGKISSVTVTDSTGLTSAVTKANSALQGVSAEGKNYVSASFANNTDAQHQKLTVSATTQAVSSASSTKKGLAEASDVKSYVDSAVTNAVSSSVTGATGDTYVTATVNNKQVVVATAQSTKDSLAKADTALQTVGATGDTLVSASFANKSNNNQGLTVAATTALSTAVSHANSAVQSVNSLTGTAVTLDTADIKLDANITGATVSGTTATTVQTMLTNLAKEVNAQAGAKKVTDVDYSSDKKIRLKYSDNTYSTGFDASAFIKDGMVDNVVYTASSHTLTITFNTDAGKEAIPVDLSSLVDVYTADNKTLQVSNGQFSAKTAAVSASTTSSDNLAKASDVKSYVDAAVAGKNVSAEGKNYISATAASNKVTVSAQTQAVSTATGTSKGLAEASDVKTYVDNAVSGKNVDATGDTYVTASAANNKVTVGATTAITTPLGYANTALQTVGATGDTLVSASFDAKSGDNGAKTQGLSVAATTALTTAVEHANSAVQSVNSKTGTAVTINTNDIKVGTAITGATVSASTDTTVQTLLKDLTDKVNVPAFIGSVEDTTAIDLTVDSNGKLTADVLTIDCGTF